MDRVNKPSHYQFPGGVQPLDLARHLNFNCGNVVKYVARAGRKSEVGMGDKEKKLEDLRKALFYIHDEIKRVEDYED